MSLTAQRTMGGATAFAPAPPDMNSLIQEKHKRAHTVFHPGARIKMNIVPMFLNLFVPWSIFTFICGICSSWVMYSQPGLAMALIMAVFGVWGASVYQAVKARKENAEPTWFSFVALAVGIAAFAGMVTGLTNFSLLLRPYYSIHDLKVIRGLDPGTEHGQNVMDAGIVSFALGSGLDGMRSWHFKHGRNYCVAPIIVNSSAPGTGSYDFWAVGKDCCSLSSSDFRCGAWGVAGSHGAVRSMDDEAAPFYRLAVKQAETLYGIVASHPVFFEWTNDPQLEVNSWSQRAWKNFLLMVGMAFVVSLFAVTSATCKYAWIGRGGALHIYGDTDWETAGQTRPLNNNWQQHYDGP